MPCFLFIESFEWKMYNLGICSSNYYHTLCPFFSFSGNVSSIFYSLQTWYWKGNEAALVIQNSSEKVIETQKNSYQRWMITAFNNFSILQLK